MPDFTITREDPDPRRGRYVARIDGQEAELVYTREGDVVSADHTGVPKELEGRGIGSALLDALLKDARTQGFRGYGSRRASSQPSKRAGRGSGRLSPTRTAGGHR